MSTQPRSLWTAGEPRLHLSAWEGRGPVILLTHGMAGNTHWWDKAAPLLGRDFSPVALDFSGHGDSGWRKDGQYGSPAWTADIETARRTLASEKIVLCGHSLGARVALDYATLHPEHLDAVILVDFLPELYMSGARRFERTRTRSQPRYADARAMAERFRLQPPGTLLDADQLKILGLQSLRPDGEGYTWKFDWRAFANRYEPVWSVLPKLKVPALIVRGERSVVMDRPSFDRVLAAVPGAQGVEIPHAHHHVPLDCPRELAESILAFARLGRTLTKRP